MCFPPLQVVPTMPAAKPRPVARLRPLPPAQPGPTIATWLSAEVLPVYGAMQSDPSRGIPSDKVVAALEAHHAGRLKKTASGA